LLIGLWTACLVGAASAAEAQLTASVYASGFDRPVEFVQDPVLSPVQYIVEQGGRVRVIFNGIVQPTDFLNLTGSILSDGEQGLLGLAFAPDYATSGRVFVTLTNLGGDIVVARFVRSASNLFVADPSTRFDLRWGGPNGIRAISHPFSNHNGGHIEFGPDGYLYIGLGDGGAAGDPFNNAQDPQTLLGKILRIDVNVPDSDEEGYVVPPDNPFASGGALPEIWAFGLRNPWKFTVDRSGSGGGGTGALLIADVGQGEREEVDYEPSHRGGRNYGWSIREGQQPFLPERTAAFEPLQDPVIDYSHADGHAIIGGYVYRGSHLAPGFQGRYFFADFVFGRVWSLGLSIDGNGEATAADLIDHTEELGSDEVLGNISSFGVDAQGEVYILSFNGKVFKINGGASGPLGMASLSITPPTGGTVFGPGLQCGVTGTACVVTLPGGVVVGLEAVPAQGFVFSAWTGPADCTDGLLVLTASIACSATFSGSGSGGPPPPPPPSGLQRITLTPPTGGTIVGPGLNCGTGGSACVIDLPAGMTIGLETQAAAGFAFSAWTGDADCADGQLTMTTSISCSATFSGSGSGGPPPPPPSPPPPSGLQRLTVVPPGGGTIVGPALNCGAGGSACSVDLPAGIVIGLEAVPVPGFSFTGWTGDADCADGQVSMISSVTCSATFSGSGPTPPPPPPPAPSGLVRLTVAASGSGTVRAAGIVCGVEGSECIVDLPAGIVIGFDVTPAPGFEFSGWVGSGCGPTIVLDSARTCTAVFVPHIGAALAAPLGQVSVNKKPGFLRNPVS
jgi:glucose/arabinose dehydrogenase